MATKVDQKWSQIGVESSQTEPENTSFYFFEILGPFGEPLGDNFGAERHEKYVQKSSRKSRTKKYQTSYPKVPETNAKMHPKSDTKIM